MKKKIMTLGMSGLISLTSVLYSTTVFADKNVDTNINHSISKDTLKIFEEATSMTTNNKSSIYDVRFNYSTETVYLYKRGSLVTSFSIKTGAVGYGYVTSGNKVIAAQVVLNQAAGAKGLSDSIDVDGYWGPKSQALAKKIQGKCGLTQDGLVGRKTWNAIFNIPGIGL